MRLVVIAGVVLFIGANVLLTALRSRTYPSYWRDRMNESRRAAFVVAYAGINAA